MTHPENLLCDDAGVASEFPLEEDLIYLNHAAIGPWPRRTARAVSAFAEENMRRACSRSRPWLEAEQEARQRLATLLAVSDVDDVALLKNTSEAVSLVAAGLAWRAGDNVVLPANEFPANRRPWTALAQRGVEARLVELQGREDPVATLLAHCDARTRLLAVSAVQFDTGLRLDLETLAAGCRARGVLLLVDAIQALGAVAIDWSRVAADFLVGSVHKWLLAPEGVAYLCCRGELREQLALQQFGWRMVERPFDFAPGEPPPSTSARRFEAGTLNTVGLAALGASLSLILELGTARIERQVLANTAWLIEALAPLAGCEIVTPRAPAQHAGIVALRFAERGRLDAVYRALGTARIITAVRAELLRLSPHFHTPRRHLERTVAVIADALA